MLVERGIGRGEGNGRFEITAHVCFKIREVLVATGTLAMLALTQGPLVIKRAGKWCERFKDNGL